MVVIKMNAKRIMVTVGGIVFLALSGVLFAGGQGEPENPTIVLGVVPSGIWVEAQEMASEFTAETGIKVEWEVLRAPDLNTKIRLESEGQTGYFDILRTSSGQVDLWHVPGWTIPLDDFIANSPEFEISDWIPEILKQEGLRDGEIHAIPETQNTKVLAYRTDLFYDEEERRAFEVEYGYELRPPETTDEWLDTAEFFTRPDEGLYGMALGQLEPTGFYWPWYGVATFGVTLIDMENYRSGINDPRAYEAFEWMREMQKTMPPGIRGWRYKEEVGHFAAGRLAMVPVMAAEVRNLIDPEKSEYHDRVAFTTFPYYPENQVGLDTGVAHLGGGSISISSHSENPEAAWEFIKWFLGPENAMELARRGVVLPRRSVLENEELFEIMPEYKLFFEPYMRMLANAEVRPSIPEADEMFDELAWAYGDFIAGDKTVEEAILTVEENINKIFREAGYPD